MSACIDNNDDEKKEIDKVSTNKSNNKLSSIPEFYNSDIVLRFKIEIERFNNIYKVLQTSININRFDKASTMRLSRTIHSQPKILNCHFKLLFIILIFFDVFANFMCF